MSTPPPSPAALGIMELEPHEARYTLVPPQESRMTIIENLRPSFTQRHKIHSFIHSFIPLCLSWLTPRKAFPRPPCLFEGQSNLMAQRLKNN